MTRQEYRVQTDVRGRARTHAPDAHRRHEDSGSCVQATVVRLTEGHPRSESQGCHRWPPGRRRCCSAARRGCSQYKLFDGGRSSHRLEPPLCCDRMHNAAMASITVRDVPDDVRNELASRAALAGRSLQEHLRSELIELARRPSADQLLARVRERKSATGTRLSDEEILGHRDADRR